MIQLGVESNTTNIESIAKKRKGPGKSLGAGAKAAGNLRKQHYAETIEEEAL